MAIESRMQLQVAVCGLVCLLLPAANACRGEDYLGQGGTNALAVHSLGQKGKGLRVGLIAAFNARSTHEAFRDRTGRSHVFCMDYAGESAYKSSDHDTWVAGVICGRGGPGHETNTGVAPEADLYSAKVSRGIRGPEDANRTTYFAYVAGAVESLVAIHNCRVIVTAMAFQDSPDHHPDGENAWSLLYDYYACTHNTLFVSPSGKQFRAPTVFGDAYNGITVAGLVSTEPGLYNRVGSASNSGPTIDGRRKPDVAAPASGIVVPTDASDTSWYVWPANDGATSFAAPCAGGVAALLLGLADSTPEPDDDRNVVIKAVIINAAGTQLLNKAGKPAALNGTAAAWDPDYGFGRIDAFRSYNTLKAGRISKGRAIEAEAGWAYGSLASGAEDEYQIRTRKDASFVCTLVWNRRVIWEDFRSFGFIDAGELKGVQTRLDMAVSRTDLPDWGLRPGKNGNRPDNVIKYSALVPADCTVTVKVVAPQAGGGPIPYGLAFELRETGRHNPPDGQQLR